MPESLGLIVLMPQVLTANRLVLGEVVYWNTERGWVTRLNEAQLLSDAEAEAALSGAAEWVERQEVVAPYLFDARLQNGVPAAASVREAIRAAGPTVRPDLGKQAE